MSIQAVLNKYNKFYRVIIITQFYRNIAWSCQKINVLLKNMNVLVKYILVK